MLHCVGVSSAVASRFVANGECAALFANLSTKMAEGKADGIDCLDLFHELIIQEKPRHIDCFSNEKQDEFTASIKEAILWMHRRRHVVFHNAGPYVDRYLSIYEGKVEHRVVSLDVTSRFRKICALCAS